MDISKLIKLTIENQNFCRRTDLPTELDPEAKLFVMAFNHLKIAEETFALFNDCWAREVGGKSAQALEEKFERCMDVGKTLFIRSVSSVEYCMRSNIRASNFKPLLECLDRRERVTDSFFAIFPPSLECCAQRVRDMGKIIKDLPPVDSIKRVVERSEKEELISSNFRRELEFTLYLRNCIVHNNGISDRDMTETVRSKEFKFFKGKMMTADDIGFFVDVTEHLIEIYANWLLNLRSRAGVAT